jgi:ribonuclease Z
MRTTFHPQLVNDPFGDPALYVDCLFQRRALLFDLGDIRALTPKKLLRISHVFVSHAHMDHFMGFDWLLRICLGRNRALQLFGPPGFLDQVAHKLAAYTWNLVHNYDTDFTLHVTEVDPGVQARRASFHCRAAFRREQETALAAPSDILVDEDFFRVRTTLLDHRTPCLAFALEEKAHANVWKNRLLERGLAPGPWLQQAKRAVLGGAPDDQIIQATWRESGRSFEKDITVGELRRDIVRLVPGQKIAYVTDAVYHAQNARKIADLARDAEVLLIETTFLDEHKERAQEKHHLTARQAGELARQAEVKQVIPFHFSPIYRQEEQRLRDELQQAFSASGCRPEQAATATLTSPPPRG